jgi:hypothetical protein
MAKEVTSFLLLLGSKMFLSSSLSSEAHSLEFFFLSCEKPNDVVECWFVFGRSLVVISDWRLAILMFFVVFLKPSTRMLG